MYGRALIGFELVDGRYEPIETVRNEHGLLSGYSRELGVRLCVVEESEREELLEIQADLGLLFAMDFNSALLLFQEVDTDWYILDMAGLRAERDFERERAEVERERAERAEAGRRRAEAELEEERARVRELEERLRRLQE